MSEVKGTLLTIILTLAVFGAVAGVLATSIKRRADVVATQIETVDVPTTYIIPAQAAAGEA